MTDYQLPASAIEAAALAGFMTLEMHRVEDICDALCEALGLHVEDMTGNEYRLVSRWFQDEPGGGEP